MQGRSAVDGARRLAGTSRGLGLGLGVLIGSLSWYGCGPQKSGHDEAPRVAPLALTPQPPASYSFDDSGCQQEANPASLPITKAQIYSWDGLQVGAKDVSFHDTSSAQSLTSPAINLTTAGAVYQRTCENGLEAGFACSDGNGGSKGWTGLSAGTPLRLCRDGVPYQRQSVEAIGLTSLYFIQAARDRYLSVTHNDAKSIPAAIGLSIMPAFVTDFAQPSRAGKETVTRTYITDNLAYFPDARMIAVFPVKADEKDSWPGFYWESSFVLGHEYGHHIDFSRHGRVLTSVGLTWNSVEHGFTDEVTLANGGSASSARAQMAGAEAEGFADLLGYYVGNANGQAVLGLPRIGCDRDPGDGHFGAHQSNGLDCTPSQGSAKVLTRAKLEVLLGLRSAAESPAFADIHQTGAVLAYTANRVFTRLMAATTNLAAGSTEEVDGRYRLTLTFMDALVAEVVKLNADTNDERVSLPLTAAFEAATKAALDQASAGADVEQLKKEVCTIVAGQMPGLARIPFSAGGRCG